MGGGYDGRGEGLEEEGFLFVVGLEVEVGLALLVFHEGGEGLVFVGVFAASVLGEFGWD